MTALVIGQPITNEVAVSRVTSETSEMQVESQTSDRGTWSFSLKCEDERS